MNIKELIIIPSVLLLVSITTPSIADEPVRACTIEQLEAKLPATSKINPEVYKLALKARDCAIKKGIVKKPNILTIIDYTLPSYKDRLWVIDLKNDKVLFHLPVAHGKGTGGVMATHFSDQANTNETSIGLILTGNSYNGHDGYALRLIGLEKGFNDKALSRAVVMHGAWYATPTFIKQHGRAGRSWGCEAIDPKYIKKVVNTVKDGSLILSYYPKSDWLTTSKYLNCKN